MSLRLTIPAALRCHIWRHCSLSASHSATATACGNGRRYASMASHSGLPRNPLALLSGRLIVVDLRAHQSDGGARANGLRIRLRTLPPLVSFILPRPGRSDERERGSRPRLKSHSDEQKLPRTACPDLPKCIISFLHAIRT